MSSKIKVDNIADQGNNNMLVKCGSTLTIGATGNTITLAAGASQTGFGRTGTVDWDTTPKTATFTAVNGDGFFANTTASAFNMNLPAGTPGAIVSVADYAATWQNNNLTVVPNGSDKIGGLNANLRLDTEGQSVTLLFVDSTQGWINIQDSTSNERASSFMSATGGTVTTCGNCKIHTFTGPGTFCVSSIGSPAENNEVSYMVVAGAGGGGWDVGGGGGAGGFRENKSPLTPYTASPKEGASDITVTQTSFPITVGAGGNGASSPGTNGSSGSNSVFSTITSAGGGGGGSHNGNDGSNGGSGGGGAGYTQSTTGGSGNIPSTSPPQGNNGGNATSPSTNQTGGGGGGATAAGSNGTSPATAYASGGAGAATGISGSSVTYSEGGRGAGDSSPSPQAGGANTGDGADGGGAPSPPNPAPSGGSGVVIIRYKFQ